MAKEKEVKSEVESVDMKMIYDAVITLTKEVGKMSKGLQDVYGELDLKKRSGKF